MNGEIVKPKRPRVATRKPGEFAQDTTVPVVKTRFEIEQLVGRAGGKKYSTHQGDDFAAIAFELGSRRILLKLPLPSVSDSAIKRVKVNQYDWRPATAQEREKAWEQACRARWRALYLVIKAKLEAITVGVATMEDEFLAYTVLPNQQTVGEWANPQVDEVYATGEMPPMMPGLPATSSLRALPGAQA